MSKVWVWRESLFETDGAPPSPTEIPELPAVAKIVAAHGSLLALASDGAVWHWQDTRDNLAAPQPDLPLATKVAGLTDVTDIFSSSGANYAIRADGTLWSWGENHSGQLGDGTTDARCMPVQVLTLTNVGSVTPEKGSTFAVQTDGSVWAWGRDHSGTLGDGTQYPPRRTVTSPVRLPNLTDVVSVSTSFPAPEAENGYALRADGSVWAWGDDADGQLGDGTMQGRWAPVPVTALSDVVAVTTGWTISHDVHVTAYALTSHGTVWAWGANDGGQLGDGTTASRATPAPVQGLTDVVAVSPHLAAVYALKSDGTVWHWGSNLHAGGVQVATVHTHPVQMLGLPRIAAISAHLSHAYATGVDGSVWRWDHGWAAPPEMVPDVSDASSIAQCYLQFSAALSNPAGMLQTTERKPFDTAKQASDMFAAAARHYQRGENDEAVACWQRAADGGNPQAMYELARYFHLTGREPETAIGLILRAAVMGLKEAKEALIETRQTVQMGQAEMLLRGYELRFPEGSHEPESLSAGGIAMSMFSFGVQAYEEGDDRAARAWFLRAAEEGDANAMNNLGAWAYKEGDRDGARDWLARAADLQHPEALKSLGVMADEDGDRATARMWYTRAAEHGQLEALNNLAVMVNEDGDRATALMLWKRAADEGDPDAMFNLGGQASREGDWATAQAWWTRAAEMGHLRSMHNLVVSLLGESDRTGARFWLGRAAELGDANAMNNLGALAYEEGDWATARMWLTRAAQLGHGAAMENLERMAE